MHYLLLLAAMQYLHFGIKAGDGPRYAAQPLLIDRHNGFSETWRIENGSSGDCKCYEFFISNSWPALTQRILDFLGANMLCWNVLKKLHLNGLQWLPPHHCRPLPGRASSPSVQPLLPASYLLLAALRLPCWHCAGSRQEWGGVSEYTIRSWRRSLPSPGFYSHVTWIVFTAGRPKRPLAASSHFCWLLPHESMSNWLLLQSYKRAALPPLFLPTELWPQIEKWRGKKMSAEGLSTSPALTMSFCSNNIRIEPGANLPLLAWDTSNSPQDKKPSWVACRQGGAVKTRADKKWQSLCRKHKAKSACDVNETLLY